MTPEQRAALDRLRAAVGEHGGETEFEGERCRTCDYYVWIPPEAGRLCHRRPCPYRG